MSVSDLTGTKWVLNSNYALTSTNYNFSLNFTSGGNSYTSLVVNGTSFSPALARGIWYNDAQVWSTGAYWSRQADRIIEITGGTDVANPDLITWLEANGTLTAPVVANTYELIHSLTNLTHGNISFTITPDTGYELPSSVTVTNGTLVSYDSSTGVVVVSGDDTTTISAECEEQPSGFEVELYGSLGAGEIVYVQINDDPTWYYAHMNAGGSGFPLDGTNIPNAYAKSWDFSIGIPNVSKIKIGTGGNPTSGTGPQYLAGDSTGDFTNLTFTSTGSSAPAYATGEITMTQDSTIVFYGDD